MRRMVNPFSPPALAGLANVSPIGRLHEDHTYVLPVDLTALQAGARFTLAIDTDSDFLWRAIFVAANTGAFTIFMDDSDSYRLSNAPLVNAALSANAAAPTPIFPEIVLGAGSRIGFEFTDLSNAPNSIQIACRGVKSYLTAPAPGG